MSSYKSSKGINVLNLPEAISAEDGDFVVVTGVDGKTVKVKVEKLGREAAAGKVRRLFLGGVYFESGLRSLNGERGDWCKRLDLGGAVFELVGDDATVLSNWREYQVDQSGKLDKTGGAIAGDLDVDGAVTHAPGDAGNPEQSVNFAQGDARYGVNGVNAPWVVEDHFLTMADSSIVDKFLVENVGGSLTKDLSDMQPVFGGVIASGWLRVTTGAVSGNRTHLGFPTRNGLAYGTFTNGRVCVQFSLDSLSDVRFFAGISQVAAPADGSRRAGIEFGNFTGAADVTNFRTVRKNATYQKDAYLTTAAANTIYYVEIDFYSGSREVRIYSQNKGVLIASSSLPVGDAFFGGSAPVVAFQTTVAAAKTLRVDYVKFEVIK